MRLSPFLSRASERCRSFAKSGRFAAAFAGLGLVAVLDGSLAAQIPGSVGPRIDFAWERGPDLPDPVGLKGMFAGVSNGMIILAGGSNFPVARSEGGVKRMARRIFVRPITDSAAPWSVSVSALPVGLAEGASVTTEHGVVAIGGQGEGGPVATVVLLRWNEETSSVQQSELPDLPVPCANAAAVYWQNKIYVAGGDANGQGLANFWILDLVAAMAKPARDGWTKLPPWPGPRRFGAVLAVLEKEGREQLFLFGGRVKTVGAAQHSDYLDDAFRYDPSSLKWTALARMPHPALLAAAVRISPSQLAMLGGSDGHDLDRMAELGERYRLPDHIVVYDADADRWRDAGTMPLGVVGAAVVELPSGWLVAGGEYSPALRTSHVYRLTLKTLPQPDREAAR